VDQVTYLSLSVTQCLDNLLASYITMESLWVTFEGPNQQGRSQDLLRERGLGDGSPPSGVQGQSPGGVSGL